MKYSVGDEFPEVIFNWMDEKNEVKRNKEIIISVLPMNNLLALDSSFFFLFFENEKLCFINLY